MVASLTARVSYIEAGLAARLNEFVGFSTRENKRPVGDLGRARALLVELDGCRGVGSRRGNRSVGNRGAGIVPNLELEGRRFEVSGAGDRLEGAEIAGCFRIGERHPVGDRRGIFDYCASPRERAGLLAAPLALKGCLETRVGRFGYFVLRSNRDVFDYYRLAMLEGHLCLAVDNVQSPLARRAARAQGVGVVYRFGSQLDFELEGKRVVGGAGDRFLYLQATVRTRVLGVGDGDVSIFAVIVLPLKAAFHSRNRIFDHAVLIVPVGIQPGEGVEPRIAAIEDGALYIRIPFVQVHRDRRGIRALIERLPHRKHLVELAGEQGAVAGDAASRIGSRDVSLEHHRCGVPCLLLVRFAYFGSKVFAGDNVLVSVGFERFMMEFVVPSDAPTPKTGR